MTREELEEQLAEVQQSFVDATQDLLAAKKDAVAARAEAAKAWHAAALVHDWTVALDGGRSCEICETEIRRGEAVMVEPGTGGLVEHVICPRRPS